MRSFALMIASLSLATLTSNTPVNADTSPKRTEITITDADAGVITATTLIEFSDQEGLTIVSHKLHDELAMAWARWDDELTAMNDPEIVEVGLITHITIVDATDPHHATQIAQYDVATQR